MDEVNVRRESTKDRAVIRILIVETFSAAYGTGDLEADLVERLREQTAFGSNISLGSTKNGITRNRAEGKPTQRSSPHNQRSIP